jgi:hypothetical protein
MGDLSTSTPLESIEEKARQEKRCPYSLTHDLRSYYCSKLPDNYPGGARVNKGVNPCGKSEVRRCMLLLDEEKHNIKAGMLTPEEKEELTRNALAKQLKGGQSA